MAVLCSRKMIIQQILVFVVIAESMTDAQAHELYLRCYKGAMDRVLCNDPYQILIRNAYYADNGPVTQCRDSAIPSNLCKELVAGLNHQYYLEILQKCNGFRACKNLVAGKAKTSCNHFLFNPKSDYILLEYSCLLVPTTSSTTASTTHTTHVTSIELYPSTTIDDGQLSTVSEFNSSSANEAGIYKNQTVATSNVTGSTPRLYHGLTDNGMLALKVTLPLILIILAIIAVVLFFLLKNRRKSSDTAEDSNTTENESQKQCVVFTNATYENSSTLQIRQSIDTDLTQGNKQAPASGACNTDAGSMHYPSAANQNRPLPVNPYVDMTYSSDKSKNKFKAWFKNRTSELGFRKESATTGHETEPPMVEAIYAEPMEPHGGMRPSTEGTCGYSVERAPSCNGVGNPTSGVLENHYAVSPIIGKHQGDNEYISMNKNTNTPDNASSGDPPPMYDQSGHYSEIEMPVRSEDIEGIYSSPKNNQLVRVEPNHDESTNKTRNDMPTSLKPADITYENIKSKSSEPGQEANSVQKEDEPVTSLA